MWIKWTLGIVGEFSLMDFGSWESKWDDFVRVWNSLIWILAIGKRIWEKKLLGDQVPRKSKSSTNGFIFSPETWLDMKLCSKSFDVITFGHLGGEHGLFYMSLLLGMIPMDNVTIHIADCQISGIFFSLNSPYLNNSFWQVAKK